MAKSWAMTFGIVFILVGLLGFVPNPIVGPNALFHTMTAHNWAHLLTGFVLVFAATQTERASYYSLLLFGGVYALLTVLGFLLIGDDGFAQLFGFLHINGNDNWLHLFLTVVLLGAAFGSRKQVRHVHAH